MKVKDAIAYLTQAYKGDDELFIVWWDKGIADDYAEDHVTSEQWVNVVKQLNEDEYLFHAVNDTITELANTKEEGV